MSYAESIDDNIDQGDEEDNNRDDIIENVRHLLILLVVDVHAAQDQEQNTDNDLKQIFQE